MKLAQMIWYARNGKTQNMHHRSRAQYTATYTGSIGDAGDFGDNQRQRRQLEGNIIQRALYVIPIELLRKC